MGDLQAVRNWYVETFTLEERKRIAETFRPLGIGGNWRSSLDSPPAQQIWSLVSWFKAKHDASLALRLADGGLRFAESTLDRHFALHAAISAFYRNRALGGNLERAESLCREQIELAPKAKSAFVRQYGGPSGRPDPLPTHMGFKQLAIILEKRKDYAAAIKFCESAANQGWKGDWDDRIERLKRRNA
jgi:hypothetical protein